MERACGKQRASSKGQMTVASMDREDVVSSRKCGRRAKERPGGMAGHERQSWWGKSIVFNRLRIQTANGCLQIILP